jgi:two-component system phosphate regulon response regulator PhoB
MKGAGSVEPRWETLHDEYDEQGRRMLVPVVTVVARVGDVDQVLRELARKLDVLLQDGEQRAPRDVRGPITRVGVLCLDQLAWRVTVDGHEVALTGLEFRLLVALLERRDRVLSRGELLRDVWASSAHNRTRTVDVHVQRLRNKIGAAGRYIQTVRGAGYRFSASAPGAAREEGS